MNFDEYLRALPKLHVWGGKETAGGITKAALRGLRRLVPVDGEILETGAGNSSLTFILSGARRVVTVCPDAAVFERISAFAKGNDISMAAFEPVVGRSETCLPKMLEDNRRFELAFIDGGHGWPTVFVDFCFCNAMLKKQGVMVISDCEKYSVGELTRFLCQQPEFSLIDELDGGKLSVFKKKTDQPFLPDWARQPYIRAMTEKSTVA